MSLPIRIGVFCFAISGVLVACSEGTFGPPNNTQVARDALLDCPADANIIMGTEGDDVLSGTNGSDCIVGLGGNDELFGNNGDDWLYGGAGDDTLDGGRGDDFLDGGEGNDVLAGSNGVDELYGGDGNDIIVGGNGDDAIDGGAGNDVIAGDNGADTVYGGDGDDSIVGGSGDDAVDGGAGDDTCDGADCEEGEAPLPDGCDVDADCDHPDQTCLPLVGICVFCLSDLDCGDGDVCTDDVCQPFYGCVSAALSDDTPCPDDDFCNGTETCQAGICTGGAPLVCDDGVDCTVDSCDSATGCAFAPDDSFCADGYSCTIEACDPVAGCINDVGVDRDVTITFGDHGTYSHVAFYKDTLTLSGSNDLIFTEGEGVGVLGGVDDNLFDGSESVEVTFHPYQSVSASNLSYSVSQAVDLDGDGVVGEASIEAFDVSESSLGVVFVDGDGSHDVSALFGHQPILEYVLRAEGDGFQLSTMSHTDIRTPDQLHMNAFHAQGTYSTATIHEVGITLTGSNELHVTQRTGIGIAGGDDSWIEAGETLTVDFDYPVHTVFLSLEPDSAAGCVLPFTHQLEAFDAEGNSLGVAVDDQKYIFVRDLTDEPISRVSMEVLTSRYRFQYAMYYRDCP